MRQRPTRGKDGWNRVFDRILIANRGEIACRVARTARRLGVRTVAIYSDADARAMHVAACDEAYRVGPPPARESYLDGDAIIGIARRAGAQAIHPGYGFLSENAAFATACAAAGLTFIGPPPQAIAAMGSKAEAKRLMSAAGVPVVPGYHGVDQDHERLGREAEAIGYPVLIKAVAGGGGKGMRVVTRRDEFAAALASARREAQSSFGDDRVLLERYLTTPRHIEMQVFADTHGNVLHLFERDCSVQRRHQKVLEEAPAPGMTSVTRKAMGDAAIAAARAIGYVGAGTIEFIADETFARDGRFYFMEMNTRLQVEHPVTEMITGLDLVEWQLRVASGERLPLAQEAIDIRGHAIEARIYAEDPERGFLPSIGRLAHLRFPPADAGVRVDTGVREGDEISAYYDPMLAKLIVHGPDRDVALHRMTQALAGVQVAGVTTNVAFLRRILEQGAFARAEIDTGLIARHEKELLAPPAPIDERALVALALHDCNILRRAREREQRTTTDPFSPWQRADGWWPNSARPALLLEYTDARGMHAVALRRDGNGWRVTLHDGRVLDARLLHVDGSDVSLRLDGIEFAATVVALGEERHVYCDGRAWRLTRNDRLAHAGEHEVAEGHLRAPMSGTVVAVMVKPGERVARGAPLMVLEAMKMEHTITATGAGQVSGVHYRVGDRVQEGADLVDLDVDAG